MHRLFAAGTGSRASGITAYQAVIKPLAGAI
jgi:hypothetical protein